jgi:hypothetical protein
MEIYKMEIFLFLAVLVIEKQMTLVEGTDTEPRNAFDTQQSDRNLENVYKQLSDTHSCDHAEWKRLLVQEWWTDYFGSTADLKDRKYEELSNLTQKAAAGIPMADEKLTEICFLGLRLYECSPTNKCVCMMKPIQTRRMDDTENPQCLIQAGQRCAPINSTTEKYTFQFRKYVRTCIDNHFCSPTTATCEKPECDSNTVKRCKNSGDQSRTGILLFWFCMVRSTIALL